MNKLIDFAWEIVPIAIICWYLTSHYRKEIHALRRKVIALKKNEGA